MRAIIVAAGAGRRLSSITKDIPKCLIDIGSKKVIDFTLGILSELGIHDIAIVVGHKKEKIKEYLGDSVRYIENSIYNMTNSLYSLYSARNFFGDEFLYFHSDIIFEKSILEKVLSEKGDIVLCVDEKRTDDEDMKVRIENGLITEINKLIPSAVSRGEFIGIAKLRKNGIGAIKEAAKKILKDKANYNVYFEYAVECLIKEGHKIYPCLMRDKFYVEIDYEKDILKAKELMLKKGILSK